MSLQESDELLQSLSPCEIPGYSYAREPRGSRGPGEEAGSGPRPEYCDDGLAFFWLTGRPCWSDLDYDARQASASLQDDRSIDTCILDQLKTLLTACACSERAADGAWPSLLESGRIVTLLKRLAAPLEALWPVERNRP